MVGDNSATLLFILASCKEGKCSASAGLSSLSFFNAVRLGSKQVLKE